MTIVQSLKSALGMDPTRDADPDMHRVLEALKSLHPKPIEGDMSAEEARRQPLAADAVKKLLSESGASAEAVMPADVRTEEISIPGLAGANRARVYYPDNEQAENPLPVILYFRGGGFAIADLDAYDATPRSMAALTESVIISLDYRLAPENKFPAAYDDAFAAYQWLLENASSLNGDPSRIAVMGESAGGNLAINVSIWARDQGLPPPLYQVLIYPLASTDVGSASYNENSNAQPLNKPMMLWFVQQLLADPRDKGSRLLRVIEADLHDLPSTTLITAGIDPLRSEGETLVERLQDAGVRVRYRNFGGATHEFFGMAAVVAAAREAQALVAEDLREAFSQAPGGLAPSQGQLPTFEQPGAR
ncbi:MAG: alpha/beta hydrolase [Janthinobacterium lividum]